MNSDRCVFCGGVALPDVIERAEGTAGLVQVALVGLPATRCTECGKAVPCRTRGDEFPAALTGELLEPETIPTAARRGIFRRVQVCCRCTGELPKEPSGDVKLSVELRVEDFPPFQAEITMPGWNCPRCGETQSAPGSRLDDNLVEAVADAFENGGVLI